MSTNPQHKSTASQSFSHTNAYDTGRQPAKNPITGLRHLDEKTAVDSGCQVRKSLVSSGTQARPEMKHVGTQTDKVHHCSEKRQVNNILSELGIESVDTFNLNSVVFNAGCSDEEENWEDEEESSEDEDTTVYCNPLCLKSTLRLIQQNPKEFVGLDPTAIGVIKILQQFSKLSRNKILIALWKLRSNESNKRMAYRFSRSPCAITRAIDSAFPVVAAYVKTFIMWPERSIIQSNLPIPFRIGYSRVESIIDCFEIRIEKPPNLTHQCSTWSSEENCATVKYLVSSTPDGCINFISQGFTGSASDYDVVVNSGYLDKLKEGAVVMADWKFKQLQRELKQRKCSLVTPDRVPIDHKPSEEESCRAEEISSRIFHIKRVIKRIMEYKLVGPEACFNDHMLGHIDSAVVIACALSNLQESQFI